MAGGHISLVELKKRFGAVTAVDGISVEIEPGEFFSLLGPSGCGKTTTLRMVAGFEEPTSGAIFLDGSDVGRLPPNKRNVNTVFQNYALFPFLNVADNVRFGLRYQRLTKSEVNRKVGEALDLVQLGSYQRRRPGQLSGGQQQRVALARALVLNPAVLLLDEPLGALDAKLRRALQVELKALQERVGITFLYVTHDQEEALTMSDRLAVMSNGCIAQLGSPRQVYEEPTDAFVADFLGISNLMEAVALGPGGGDGLGGASCRLKLGDFELRATCGALDALGDVKLAIRPERVQLRPYGDTGLNRVPGMVERVVFLGSASQVLARLAPGATLHCLLHNDGEPVTWRQGDPVSVELPPDALRVLPNGSATVKEIREETLGDEPPDLAGSAPQPSGRLT